MVHIFRLSLVYSVQGSQSACLLGSEEVSRIRESRGGKDWSRGPLVVRTGCIGKQVNEERRQSNVCAGE